MLTRFREPNNKVSRYDINDTRLVRLNTNTTRQTCQGMDSRVIFPETLADCTTCVSLPRGLNASSSLRPLFVGRRRQQKNKEIN